MRVRKKARRLSLELCNEIQTELRQHNCNKFYIDQQYGGLGCVICLLCATAKLPLATLHQLRKKHKSLLKILQYEEALIELLGEDGYKHRMKKEIETFRSFPRFVCKQLDCQRLVSFIMSYTSLFHLVTAKERVTGQCVYCGNGRTLTLEDFNKDIKARITKEKLDAIRQKAIVLGLVYPKINEPPPNILLNTVLNPDIITTNTANFNWEIINNNEVEVAFDPPPENEPNFDEFVENEE